MVMQGMTECDGVGSSWDPTVTGAWRVVCTDPIWGSIPILIHPYQEDVAQWVAENHNTTTEWVYPTNEDYLTEVS